MSQCFNSRLTIKGLRVSFFAVMLVCAAFNIQAQTGLPTTNDSVAPEQDYFQELDKWMLRAYEGDRDAQFKVGVLFAGEDLQSTNPEQAVYWYTQAARQGHILAQYNLGHHLLTGNGTDINESEAIQWWQEAAKEDHALAQFNVGRAYFLGIGVDEDHDLSKYWFSRAAQNKEPKAIEVLDQLGWQQDLTLNTQGSASPIDPTLLAPVASSDQTPLGARAGASNSEQELTTPVALYTDPALRNVLITIVEDRENLRVVEISDDWVIVTHAVGLPVWVYGDYLSINADKATVKGSNVNARSVPLVSTGTIVGKLQQGEELIITDRQQDWYRLTSPSSFRAWVKSEDYDRPYTTNTITGVIARPAEISPEGETDGGTEAAQANSAGAIESSADTAKVMIVDSANAPAGDIDDNAWLFGQAKESYTLQLASFDDQQKVETFLSESNLDGNAELHRFTATSKDITWIYFLFGNYNNRGDAEAAKVAINQSDAWIRSLGRIQENRCLAWKTKLPTPQELNQYCNQ
ncbi:MAG: SEL1-like repeat protein [Acidiferrobacterales bacterium]|nr:SEL1-like repeat protein [Acidiferrobacterales bacterium]